MGAVTEPGPVPAGGRRRLLTHYGATVEGWLERAPGMFAEAAQRWNLTLSCYHDAGHASLLMVAREGGTGREVMLKTWPDRDRYRNEVLALRAWAAGPVPQVLGCADDLAVMAMELVGAAPGGAPRPSGEIEPVAAALQRLHLLGVRAGVPTGALPSLQDFLDVEVLPRIHRRLRDSPGSLLPARVGWGEILAGPLGQDASRVSVLHADLYRENVLFDSEHRPALIDPLPMVGDIVFDWAFWTVYYDLGSSTLDRFETATRTAGLDPQRLLQWCLTLCLDGLLYYREVGDERVPVMEQVITTLAGSAGQTDPTERRAP
ncbi:aminoglycoside phosphotransferase family protein [Kitasatospora sp. NPDC001574]